MKLMSPNEQILLKYIFQERVEADRDSEASAWVLDSWSGKTVEQTLDGGKKVKGWKRFIQNCWMDTYL